MSFNKGVVIPGVASSVQKKGCMFYICRLFSGPFSAQPILINFYPKDGKNQHLEPSLTITLCTVQPIHNREMGLFTSGNSDGSMLRMLEAAYAQSPSMCLMELLVVYQLQKVSGKSSWKVNGRRFLGPFQWNMSGRKVLFSPQMFQTEIRVHFFEAIFDTSFSPSRPFFWLMGLTTRFQVEIYHVVLNFAYPVRKPSTNLSL